MQRFSGLELRKISINTLMQFIVRLVGSISTLLTTLLITYFLGLDAVGSFTKVIAFVSIFYLLIDFGLNSIVIKHFYKTVEEQLGNLIVLRLLITAILLPVILVFSFLLPHNEIAGTGFSDVEKGAILIYSLTLIALAINNTLQAFLQRKLNYSLLVLPSLASNAILIAVVLYAVFVGNFYLLVSAYIFSGTLMAILSYFQIKSKFKTKLKLSKFSSFSKLILLSSWPLGVMLFINLLYSRADIFILTFLKSSSDVGTYGISYRFFEIALALPAFLANSTYPLLLRASENKKEYLSLFLKYLKLYILLSIATMLLVLIFSPLIKTLGIQFIHSILPLQILAISLPFFFGTSLLQWHFLIKGKLTFLLPLYAFAFLVSILLNIKFIPDFSYIASASITVFSEALVFILMLWYFYKSKKTLSS